MNVEEHEMKDPSTPLTLCIFLKTYTLDMYFVFPLFNYLVEKCAKYIWYVEKIVILSHDFNMFTCIFIILHNFKFMNWKLGIVNNNETKVNTPCQGG